MKLGIFSDIHGNLQALQAVLRKLDQEGCEKLFCAGDVAGYGGQPQECIELVRERGIVCVQGNHDQMVARPGQEHRLRAEVRKAVTWSRENLSAEAIQWLGELPREVDNGELNMVHASHLLRPQWHYVVDERSICANFLFQAKSLSFNGHTHLPLLAIHRHGSRPRMIWLRKMKLPNGCRYLLNVGSVGQPRDHDWRAACVVFQSESREVDLHRVEYDLVTAQESIRRAGLPRFFADRLAHGR